jgi:uncharacterized protein YutE (UPF0331/DUF86 family)
LSALADYIGELRAFARFSRQEFLDDPHVYNLAERFLHLACECMLDAAQHVISEKGFRQPDDYRDAMKVLHEEGILEAELAERLKGWMGFRNVLVHLYLEIDHEKSYKAIQEELPDLDAFAARMARLLSE